MKKTSHEELLRRQQNNHGKLKIPMVVVLNNIRSLHNVGSIFRTADGAGVEKIWLCGLTGHPPRNEIKKTALGAEMYIPWEYREDVVSVLTQLKKDQYLIVVLEQTDSSIAYDQFIPQFPLCLVIGNEIEGADSSLLPLCDKAVEIEMDGVKNSLNAAVAFGVVAYHFKYRWKNLSINPK